MADAQRFRDTALFEAASVLSAIRGRLDHRPTEISISQPGLGARIKRGGELRLSRFGSRARSPIRPRNHCGIARMPVRQSCPSGQFGELLGVDLGALGLGADAVRGDAEVKACAGNQLAPGIDLADVARHLERRRPAFNGRPGNDSRRLSSKITRCAPRFRMRAASRCGSIVSNSTRAPSTNVAMPVFAPGSIPSISIA